MGLLCAVQLIWAAYAGKAHLCGSAVEILHGAELQCTVMCRGFLDTQQLRQGRYFGQAVPDNCQYSQVLPR